MSNPKTINNEFQQKGLCRLAFQLTSSPREAIGTQEYKVIDCVNLTFVLSGMKSKKHAALPGIRSLVYVIWRRILQRIHTFQR